MPRDGRDDRRPDLRDGSRADQPTVGRARAPDTHRAFLLLAIGCARPGWLVRVYGDPGRLRRVRWESTTPHQRLRRTVPAWVRAWVWKFARR